MYKNMYLILLDAMLYILTDLEREDYAAARAHVIEGLQDVVECHIGFQSEQEPSSAPV